MSNILGESLFAELTLGLGLALVAGNAFAWFKASRGEGPAEGEFRQGRVVFLILIGIVMTIWGALSL